MLIDDTEGLGTRAPSRVLTPNPRVGFHGPIARILKGLKSYGRLRASLKFRSKSQPDISSNELLWPDNDPEPESSKSHPHPNQAYRMVNAFYSSRTGFFIH